MSEETNNAEPSPQPNARDSAAHLIHVAEQLHGLTLEVVQTPRELNVGKVDGRILVNALRALSDTAVQLSCECIRLASAVEIHIENQPDDTGNLN